MGIGDFAPQTETIEFPGGSFAVRGLALQDITVLLRAHYATASALFDKYVGESALAAASLEVPGAGLDMGDPKSVVLEALEVAPGMIADVVALAADEPGSAPLVRKMPVVVQVTAIEAVIRLTMEAEGGMEKFIETVTKITGSLASVPVGRSR